MGIDALRLLEGARQSRGNGAFFPPVSLTVSLGRHATKDPSLLSYSYSQ